LNLSRCAGDQKIAQLLLDFVDPRAVGKHRGHLVAGISLGTIDKHGLSWLIVSLPCSATQRLRRRFQPENAAPHQKKRENVSNIMLQRLIGEPVEQLQQHIVRRKLDFLCDRFGNPRLPPAERRFRRPLPGIAAIVELEAKSGEW
jgi:hypothetical protein